MKIYVIGAGGVGGYFGGLLAKAGLDITFVSRGAQFTALKKNGLIVKSIAGDFTIKSLKVIDNISDISSPDLILVTVKTYDTEGIAKELSKVTDNHTTIISFQNGVENDLKIKKQLQPKRLF